MTFVFSVQGEGPGAGPGGTGGSGGTGGTGGTAGTALNFATGVNEVLKRTGSIDQSELISDTLIDSSKQQWIDLVVQLWNEIIDQLYAETNLAKPNILAEALITLTAFVRTYALPSNLVRIRFPLTDQTNGRTIAEYPGGYLGMTADQLIPTDFTGLPLSAAIRPTDGSLYLDRFPTPAEAGLSYVLRYDRDSSLVSGTDLFPFPATVFRALVPAVAQMFNLERKNKSSPGIFQASMGRAARLLLKLQPRDSWIQDIGPASSASVESGDQF